MYKRNFLLLMLLVFSVQKLQAGTWGDLFWNAAFGTQSADEEGMVPVMHWKHPKIFAGKWVAFLKEDSANSQAPDLKHYYTINSSKSSLRVAFIERECERWGDKKEEGYNMVVAVNPDYTSISYALTETFFKTKKLFMRDLTQDEREIFHTLYHEKKVKVAVLMQDCENDCMQERDLFPADKKSIKIVA